MSFQTQKQNQPRQNKTSLRPIPNKQKPTKKKCNDGRYWNRDINACVNMLNLSKEYINNRTRNKLFCRSQIDSNHV